MTDEAQNDPIALTAETLGRDLLSAMIDELKQAPEAWARMSELQQTSAIERMAQRTRALVVEALTLLFRGQYPACEATLEGIQIKRGLRLSLKVAKGARNWHELVEAEGMQVLVVVADPQRFLARMEEIKAKADQGDLFNGEYKGTNEFRRDETPPPPDKSWDDLVKSLGDGFELAAGDVNPNLSIAQQVQNLLEKVHVYVDLETCEKWTEQEGTAAAYWAMEFMKDPESAPARPHWLPIPDPSAAPQEAEDDDEPETETEADA